MGGKTANAALRLLAVLDALSASARLALAAALGFASRVLES
ncbi:hypothetical protein CH06BL_42110 [Chromobacterium haemolyticum]|nr:hypothetical protein CH06BL_42110 [Chromobacterium haemolyticum]